MTQSEETVIAFDIGGTWLRVAEVNRLGQLLWEDRRAPAHDYAKDLEFLKTMVDRRSRNVVASAFACPGPLDFRTGEILKAANLDWEGVFPGKDLRDALGLPVSVENDADCAALAEATYGGARDCTLVVWYGLGTGVGAGVIENHRIYHGAFDPEFGHQIIAPELDVTCTSGHKGCLEALISGSGLERQFGSIDRVPDEQWNAVIPRYLGWAMANATLFLSPDAIVVGGGVVDHRPDIVPPAAKVMKEMVGEHFFTPKAYVSTLGRDVGLLGAAASAWQLRDQDLAARSD